jgi:hypothetical protein
MKNSIVKLKILIFIISSTAFGQESNINRLNKELLIKSADCISTRIFLGKESDVMVAILNANLRTTDSNPNSYFIQSSEAKNIELINVLSKNSVLNEVFTLNLQENVYEEVKSGKILKSEEVELFLQMDFYPTCQNNKLFVLITDVDVAKKVTLELTNLFEKNMGLIRLYNLIKT